MESTESVDVHTTSTERRRGSQRDRPWDTPTAGRRPSAYAHYKKLVHDFDNLEEDLEQTRVAQEQYEAQLNHHKSKVEGIEKQQREREHAAWLRERERQIEAICVHQASVDALKDERSALEEEEIRLQAELEVLNERQQQENESEAKKISDLVHKRPSLLENELVKGQMDIEFLTQIVTTSKRKSTTQANAGGDALHALVDTIQQRRQDAFRAAAAQFEERLHSFEAEKEALRKKAEEIEWKKQRALKILSSNQQQVIQGFFTTPRAAIQEANPPLPSLAFSEILDGIKQPSGDAVSRLQEFEYVKHSARRQLGQALAEAEKNLQMGPKKLEQLEQKLKDRQQDALRLNLPTSRSIGDAQSGYDGRWGVETYRQDQYGVVYFMRGMVFEWMERAVDISRKQPERALLELEIQRHQATRVVMEQLDNKQRAVDCAALVAHDIEHEVIQEIVQSIYKELLHSATRVRDIILQEIKQICFSPPQPTKATVPRTAPALRWGLFGAAWDELRHQHSKKANPTTTAHNSPRRLLMQPAKPASALPAAAQVAVSSSPKKRFGLFAGGSKPKASHETITAKPNSSAASTTTSSQPPEVASPQKQVPVRVSSTDVPASSPVTGEGLQTQAIQLAEQTLWQSQITVVTKSFSSLSTCAFVSCIQISTDGRLLAVGTIDNELMVFSLLDEGETVAIAVRAVSVSKSIASHGNSSNSTRKITRLCFSGCGRRVIAYDQFKVVTLWLLALPPTNTHSNDCFGLEAETIKPAALNLITMLEPQELTLEPPVLAEILEVDAPVAAARLQSAAPLTITAFNFFSTVSMTGEQPFVLVGMSNGDIIKVLTSTKPTQVKQEPVTKQILLGSGCEASYEWPHPYDTELRWFTKPHSSPANRCSRELFRQAHQHSVLFVSSIPPLSISPSSETSTESSKTRLVSVDQSGRVALWSYSRDQFTGFGWFVPQSVCQLDLSTRSSTSSTMTQSQSDAIIKGDILQIQLSPDHKRLVLMVYFAGAAPLPAKTPITTSSAGSGFGSRLRFVQLDLSTHELTMVAPVRMEVDFTGDIPPRFVLLSIPKSVEKRSVSTVIPGSKPSQTCFLVLLMNNALHLYSLTTATLCMPSILLQTPPAAHTKSRTKNKEPTLLFNSITAASTSQRTDRGRSKTVAKVAVAGEQHKEIRVFHFNTCTS